MPGISPWAADMEDITSHSKLGHFVQRLGVLLCGCTVYWASIHKKKKQWLADTLAGLINPAAI